MAASNTNILIKRSSTTGKPSSLKAGEVAYSYVSNTLFFGTSTGDGVVNVGGQYYTATLDAATSSNTAGALVKRNADGSFSGRLLGNADTAATLQTARNFSISGGDISATAQSFDGSGAVTLNASLNSVAGLTAGVYGGVTAIPVLQVAANGRVMAISNTTVSTTLNISGDTGTDGVNLLNDTLTFTGGQGITTAVTDNVVSIYVDDTVVRANAFTGGTQTINTGLTIGANNDLTVTGNLYVFGNTTTFAIDQFEIQDPLLLLGTGNYFTDTFDIGFVSHYNDGSNAHTGLIRDAGTKEYHFFKGYTPELDANNNINLSDPSYQEANVRAAYFKGNVIGQSGQIDTLYVANRIYGDTTNNTIILAPSTNYGPGVNDQYIIIDPTAPNHIHLRAGGTIDGSSAELFLGGENTNVQVSDIAKETYISANSHYWTFANDGSTIFPTLNVNLHNGGNQNGQVLQFGDTNYQAIITGPTPGTNQNAQRLIIQGQRGNGTGEGGDVYVWGGDADTNGGDIKIYAGDADNLSSGNGGYINIDGGYGYDYGGTVEITAGSSTLNGGNLNLIAGNASDPGGTDGQVRVSSNNHNWYFDRNGKLSLPNGVNIWDDATGLYVDPVRSDASSNNVLYYNNVTKEITYGTLSDIRTDVLSNGIYSYTISGTDGGLRSNVSSQIIGGTEGGIKINYWSGANTGMQIQNEIVGEDLFIGAFDTGRALLRWHSTSVDPEIANSRVLFSAQSDGAFIKNIFWDSNTSSYLTHAWEFAPNGKLYLPHSGILDAANSSIDLGFGTKTGAVGTNRVSIGQYAGQVAQATAAIAIGTSAGQTSQGNRAVALGYFAAPTSQGQDSIAIGSFAGQYGAVQGSIILNASGSPVNGNNSGFFVSPMSYTASQDATYDGVMFYNSNTKEVRYSYALDGGEF